MRLTLKLGLAFMLANMALAVVYGYMAMRREVAIFQRQVAEEAEEMEPVIERVLADAWSSKRDAGLRDSLKTYFGGQPHPMRVRWVWFDAEAEDDRPVVPSAS